MKKNLLFWLDPAAFKMTLRRLRLCPHAVFVQPRLGTCGDALQRIWLLFKNGQILLRLWLTRLDLLKIQVIQNSLSLCHEISRFVKVIRNDSNKTSTFSLIS